MLHNNESCLENHEIKTNRDLNGVFWVEKLRHISNCSIELFSSYRNQHELMSAYEKTGRFIIIEKPKTPVELKKV